jgi:predicted HicB family RNase H-like nuclease
MRKENTNMAVQDFKTITLRLKPELYKRLKLESVEQEKSMTQIIIPLIEKELNKKAKAKNA